ncbi:MAG: FmdB family zinc ribbon protein [Elusimicrobiota bacterium]
MPIYEFVCKKCKKKFETLLMAGEKAVCPACGGDDLEKQFSTFAAQGGKSHSHSGPACSCCASSKDCQNKQ